MAGALRAEEAEAVSSLVWLDPETGRLHYAPDANGNTIPDFSQCGISHAIPEIPDCVTLEATPDAADMTAAIQEAIDTVAALDPDPETGYRGPVLLTRGRYPVAGALRITASGIVLRGEGEETVLVAAGTAERALIQIRGRAAGTTGSTVEAPIVADYVPVGARTIPVSSAGRLKPGDLVILRRAGNAAWIQEIGMDRIKPRPDDPTSTVQWTPFNLDFERRIESVAEGGEAVIIDAPLTCAIEARWGGGGFRTFNDSARITRIGIENLRGISEFDPAVRRTISGVPYAADERHATSLIEIENANEIWVRRVSARHFSFACVDIGRARNVTVSECDNGEMVSQITGSRRYSFNVEGQLCLIERCSSESGRHDFVVGSRICGPNAFVHCAAENTFATSEPHHRWSVGGLYDNVRAPIAIQDRQYYGTGHGWAGANYVVWNCEGPLVCQSPPTATNWAIGHVGRKLPGDFAPRPDGFWESHGTPVTPRSLFAGQRGNRD